MAWWLLACCSVGFLCLAAAAQVKPPSVDVLLREGQDSLDRGDFAAAAKSLEAARQLAPESKPVWHGLILAYLQGKKRAEALEVAS